MLRGVRRIVLALALAAPLSFGGCVAVGGADDTPVKKDAIGLAEDQIDDEGGIFEEEDGSPWDEDAELPPDDAELPPEDTAEQPADAGPCVPQCTSCGGANGCGGTCATGACSSGTCVAGKCITPTRSYLSPGDYAFGTAWARGITYTIGSEEPATIRYTLDGSTPGPTSPSRPSPAQLSIAASGTVLKWYADNGAREGVQSFTANISSTGQSTYGFVVERTSLGGRGPTIVVTPGATVTGTASYQAWNSTSCPMCRHQLVYGIGSTSAGCLYDWSPGSYPGASGSGAISVRAPSAPGVYPLNVSYTLQTSCAGGMGTNPLGVRPTARIATIVVR